MCLFFWRKKRARAKAAGRSGVRKLPPPPPQQGGSDVRLPGRTPPPPPSGGEVPSTQVVIKGVSAPPKGVPAPPGQAGPPRRVAAYTTRGIQLVPSNFQHIGQRKRQEDAFAFSDLADPGYVDQYGVLAVVADGMGGLARGDKASQVAVSTFLREYKRKCDSEPPEEVLFKAAHVANYAVFDLAYEGEETEVDLGTTLVAASIRRGTLNWISIGDSLIYLFRGNRLSKLNEEHIYANRLKKHVQKGVITEEDAENHPERAYLTSYLGVPELEEVDQNSEPVQLACGDAVLLCSDGLTNTLTEEEITAVMEDGSSNVAQKLVEKALEKDKRHQDNITVMVISCEPGEKESISPNKEENHEGQKKAL